MRIILLAALLFLIAGCSGATRGSGFDCEPTEPTAEGVKLQLQDFEDVVGRCMVIYNTDHPEHGIHTPSDEQPGAQFTRVPADGVVYFHLEDSGTHLARVWIDDPDDGECVYEWGAIIEYDGGLDEKTVIREKSCA